MMSSQTKSRYKNMKTKTFYHVDQKEKKAPRNIAELINYCRQHFPNKDFRRIFFELGVVSLSLSVSDVADNTSKQVRYTKNPR